MALDPTIAVLSLAVACLLLLAISGGKGRANARRIARVRARQAGMVQEEEAFSLRRKTHDMGGLVQMLARPLPNFKTLGSKLERAGNPISPQQYVLRRVLWVLLIAAVICLLFKKSLVVGVLVGLVLGAWLPLKLLQRTIAKQNKAFVQLFPEAIDLIVRGLRSGLPVSESIVLVSREVSQPVGGIFTTIADTMKLGVSMEKALQETSLKLDLTEFNFFTTSIMLQRETGGNLSEILNNLSEVLRSRYLMRMKIKAMSAEARASAIIIGALPFVVILAVSVTSPDYMKVLFTDPRGHVAVAIAACMMGFGLWVMNKMTKFEI